MSVANATAAQLKQLSDYVVQLRAISGQFMRVMAQMNALNNTYNSTISGIIGGAGVGTPVVDSSNLAGTSVLADTDVVNITSYFQGALTSYYDTAHQQVLTKAAGTGNVT
jgi:hypothetical protein